MFADVICKMEDYESDTLNTFYKNFEIRVNISQNSSKYICLFSGSTVTKLRGTTLLVMDILPVFYASL